MLITHGVDVDAASSNGGATALITALFLGREEAVRGLLTAGANVELRQASGHNALHVASFQGHARVAAILLQEGGANIAAQVDESGGTPANALSLAAKNGRLDVMKIILGAGADVEFAGDGGAGLLCDATCDGHIGLSRELENAGVSVNAVSKGATSLWLASCAGNVKVVRALHEMGADLEIPHSSGADEDAAISPSSSEGGWLALRLDKFGSAGAPRAVCKSGKVRYEIRLLDAVPSCIQLGWATPSFARSFVDLGDRRYRGRRAQLGSGWLAAYDLSPGQLGSGRQV